MKKQAITYLVEQSSAQIARSSVNKDFYVPHSKYCDCKECLTNEENT